MTQVSGKWFFTLVKHFDQVAIGWDQGPDELRPGKVQINHVLNRMQGRLFDLDHGQFTRAPLINSSKILWKIKENSSKNYKRKVKREIFSHSVKETKMLLSRRDGQLQSTIAEDRISLLPPPPDQLPWPNPNDTDGVWLWFINCDDNCRSSKRKL